MTITKTFGGISALLALISASQPSLADEIEWQIAPYIWAADVGLDLTINNDPALGISVPFKNIVDKLDGAFMLHVEGRGATSNIGGFADIISLKISDSGVIAVGPGGPVLGDLVVETELSMGLYEAGGLLRFGDLSIDSTVMDILIGARYVDVDQDLSITLPGPAGTIIPRSISVSELDMLVGVRAIGKFTDRLGYQVRGDYAGFGTDGTINLLASIGYTFGQGLFTLDLSYRYMSLELSDNLNNGANSSSEIDLSGPALGFVFNF